MYKCHSYCCRLYINFISLYCEESLPISWRSPSEDELLFTIPFNLPLLFCPSSPSLFFLLSFLPLTGYPRNFPAVTSSACSHWNCLSEPVHFFKWRRLHLLRHMFSFLAQGGILNSIFHTASSI